MIDQSSIDLRHLVGDGLKKVAGTHGGEYAGACPFCGGRDRFRVWPEQGRWWCRQCERCGDAIGLIQQRDGVSFGEALRSLGLGAGRMGNGQWTMDNAGGGSRQPAPVQPPDPLKPPPAAWQETARRFVEASVVHLHGTYRKPLEWLHRRGFTAETITAAHLGYQPHDAWLPRSAWGLPEEEGRKLWLPRGVVIPWFVSGHLWRVYIRRPVGQPKYICLPGSSNAIYNADTIRPGEPVLLVEAALDALAIQQAAGDLCAAVATGTTGGRAVSWIGRIARASLVLLAYDNDSGGDSPTAYWRDVLGTRVHIWRPYLNDPAAMLEQGMDVRGWVAAGILMAAPPDAASLEERLFAAADAGDWAVAEALAAHHSAPAGVRVFLTRLREGG